MAVTLDDWTKDTPWTPTRHDPSHAGEHCARLIATGLVWVADCRTGLGFAAVHGQELVALYLPASLRRQGWGVALLTAAKAGRDRLTLWSYQANSGALRFFQREGFVIGGFTDGGTNDLRLPDVHMIWERA